MNNDEEDSNPIEDCESTDEAGLEGNNLNHPTKDNTENLNDFLSSSSVPTPDKVDQDAETSALCDKGEFLRWHFRLGHLSYPKMKILMLLGWLPRKLLKVRPPMCACCKVGSLTRIPGRVKVKKNRGQLRKVKAPGDCVSVDQLESRTPGFIGVMRGFVTKRRYTSATIFIDHFSDLSYVHMQTLLTLEETIFAKHAFQAYARNYGVIIKHYHADNGRFADKQFLTAVKKDQQTISFCAAYVHFQNGKAEKRIRDLQDRTRRVLLHSVARWP